GDWSSDVCSSDLARELPGAADPLSHRRDHDPRPAQGAVRLRRCRGRPGAGALRDPPRAGGARDHPRQAPLPRTGAAVNVRTRTGGSWLLLGLMAAGAGCGKGKADPRAAGGAGGPPGMHVEAAGARPDTLAAEVAATGQIEALQSIELRPEVEGRIVGILFHEGQ